MPNVKLKFYLHHTAITLICLTLFFLLIQSVSYFSLSHQIARSEQVEDLAQTLARQVAFSLAPLLSNKNEVDNQGIETILLQLTKDRRILDASVYQQDGTLLTHIGESISIRDRLALDGEKTINHFNRQIIAPIFNKDSPIGFLRITLDTQVLATETRQVDNTANLLRLMILLALAIGIILTHTLLNHRNLKKESPLLLASNIPTIQNQHFETNAQPSHEENLK